MNNKTEQIIMKKDKFSKYCILSDTGILLISFYPILMGIRVIEEMIRSGYVAKENYPKYIIPYTPLCFAVIAGVFLMPLFVKIFKRAAAAAGTVTSAGVFFFFELLFENKCVVSADNPVSLKNWQMYMCISPALYQRKQSPIEILAGKYNPAFKLHFYLISVVLILSVLNCIYGFGSIIKNGDGKRRKALILQSVCTAIFLGLCIFACFTAFFRDGSFKVSPLSASLMTVFFVLLGITSGIFAGSFLLGKRKAVSVFIPSLTASVITLIMYIGEMILLGGRLYSFGNGILFRSLPCIVLSITDILTILLSGSLTGFIFRRLNKNTDSD